MLSPLRSIRTFGLYLLPASLLTTAGALFVLLLYYPTPHHHFTPAAIVENDPHINPAEAILALWLVEILRQREAGRDLQTRTLTPRVETPGFAELSARLQPAPLLIAPGHYSRRPPPIRL